MKITLTNLVLEITRRCNMKCEHCLRGKAQAIDMDFEIINRIISQTDSICGISITGGEPSLNAKAINHFRYSLNHFKCVLHHFWIATNAKFFKESFYNAVILLYGECWEKDLCALTISGDQYHYGQSNQAYEKYQELPFYSYDRTHHIKDHLVLDEGYAKENGIGCKTQKISIDFKDTYIDNDMLYVGDMVYINAKGDVLLECDLSYENQEKHKIGNVLETGIDEIILNKLESQQLMAV